MRQISTNNNIHPTNRLHTTAKMSDCGDLGGDYGDLDMAAAAPINDTRKRHRQKPSRLSSWYRSSRPASEDRRSSHHHHYDTSPDSFDDDRRSHRSSRKSYEHRHRDFDADHDALVRHRESHRDEYGRGRRARSVDDLTSSEEEEVYDHRSEREKERDRRRRHGETRTREREKPGFGAGIASKEGLAIAGVVMVGAAMYFLKDGKKSKRR